MLSFGMVFLHVIMTLCCLVQVHGLHRLGCFVTSGKTGAPSASTWLASMSGDRLRMRFYRRGQMRCFLGTEESQNNDGRAQPLARPDVDDNAGGLRQDAGGPSSLATMGRRAFVITPHQHGNRHLESLLYLAGREKHKFSSALKELEHHVQLEVAEALIFNIRYGLRHTEDRGIVKVGFDNREGQDGLDFVIRGVGRTRTSGHDPNSNIGSVPAPRIILIEGNTRTGECFRLPMDPRPS